MTEAEWLACEKPAELLGVLGTRASDRKFRLFGCCCCQMIRALLSDERSHRAVGVAERYADGNAGKDELEVARRESRQAVRDVAGLDYVSTHGLAMSSYHREVAKRSAEATADVVGKSIGKVAESISSATLAAAAEAAGLEGGRHGNYSQFRQRQLEIARTRQVAFLRDIFGNPFRPVAFSPDWRTSTAVAIAQGMYESRDFGAMPILADALQDAGCDNDDVLYHCRDENAVHVRGCWAVDLALGNA